MAAKELERWQIAPLCLLAGWEDLEQDVQRPTAQTWLEKQMPWSKSSVTRALHTLEERGLLLVRRTPGGKVVHLSEEGHALASQYLEELLPAIKAKDDLIMPPWLRSQDPDRTGGVGNNYRPGRAPIGSPTRAR